MYTYTFIASFNMVVLLGSAPEPAGGTGGAGQLDTVDRVWGGGGKRYIDRH